MVKLTHGVPTHVLRWRRLGARHRPKTLGELTKRLVHSWRGFSCGRRPSGRRKHRRRSLAQAAELAALNLISRERWGAAHAVLLQRLGKQRQ